MSQKLSRQEIKDILWERGELTWKMERAEYQGRIVKHDVQVQMYERYKAAEPSSILIYLLSRQTGKSFFLVLLALEQALKVPNSIIKFLTDTKVHAETIILPVFTEVLSDCPPHLQPEYHKQKYAYTFPNGSQIQLAGTDGKHYEKLRGQKSHLVLIDEAAFCSDLDDVITSVLLPTTTHTGGKIILTTTPPTDPNHEIIPYIERAELQGNLIVKTIFDNPLLSKETINNIIKQMGGVNSIKFRREYCCEMVRDEENTVIPEFTEWIERETVKEWTKPAFYDAYVGMDLGFEDLTAVIFGYYDFIGDVIVIEDELIYDFKQPGTTLTKFTELIVAKEAELWTNKQTNEKRKPYIRVSDINKIVTQEIAEKSHYLLHFENAKKDDNEAAINLMRGVIAAKKLIINPKCVTLIRHLKNGRWKRNTLPRKLDRSPDDSHYDALDALKYLIRHVKFGKNPYPAGHNHQFRKDDLFVKNPEAFKDKYSGNSQLQVFKKIFNRK